MKTCGYGFIAGFLAAAVLLGIIAGFIYLNSRDRGRLAYAEKQIEIEVLREGYANLDAVKLLDSAPDIRRAADGAASDFDGRLYEILQRFRNRVLSGDGYVD